MIEALDPSRGWRDGKRRADPGEDSARLGEIEIEGFAATERRPRGARTHSGRRRRVPGGRRVRGGEGEVVDARAVRSVDAGVSRFEEGERAPPDRKYGNVRPSGPGRSVRASSSAFENTSAARSISRVTAAT